jgi:rubrerythrin
MTNMTKNEIIADFETMRSFEETARDFYLRVYADPNVKDEIARKVFKRIADDEQKHVEAVDKIINVIKTVFSKISPIKVMKKNCLFQSCVL